MGSEQNDSTSFPPSEPKLCANGCGFFGTASNMNLCSKCYRDLRATEEQAASAKAAMEKTLCMNSKQSDAKAAAAAVVVNSDSVAPVVVAAESSVAAVENKVVANRCFSCNRKVGLTGFACKCGNTYCGSHRYSEKHDCPFDYKALGRNEIAKANPVVKADKLERF